MKKKNIYIILALLIIASFSAFGRIIGNDFINFDDDIYITENNFIKSGISFTGIKWSFTSFVASNWHPLTWFSHMLDWSLFGTKAFGHHLISLLFHIGAVIFLFLFLNKTTNRISFATFAAAFFAIHPLRVESVAWAAERKDVLSMFFGMASLYAYVFYTENPKLSKYTLCLILFALSLMSKPMMVTLPFVLMLFDYWPLKRWQKTINEQDKNFISTGGLIIEKIPIIILSIAVSIITFWAQNKGGAVITMAKISFSERFSNAIVSCTAYLGKIFWPMNLAVFYPFNLHIPLWEILTSAIILILITVFVFYYIKKLPFLFTGWSLYLGTLIPVIGLVQVGEQAMADRYTYLPSIGIVIMLAWGIPLLIKNENVGKKVLFPSGTIIIAILAILTWRQCGYWKNDVTLLNHALRTTENNYVAHTNLGASLFERGETREAFYHFDKAVIIKPDSFYTYINRGVAYFQLGQYQRAVENYTTAISLNGDYAEGFYKRGSTYYLLGDFQKTINDYNKAIFLKPDYAEVYNNRGTIYYNAFNQYQKSIEDYNKAIRIKPDYADAYKNRALVYLNNGDSGSGCRDARKACDLKQCSALINAQAKGLCR